MNLRSSSCEDALVFERAKQLFLEGIHFLDCGNYSDAETRFKKSLDLVPGRISSLVNLVVALVKQEKIGEANCYIDAALDIDPYAPELYLSIAEIMVARGDLRKGLQNLNHALSLQPEYWVALNNRAALYLRLRQYDLASIDLERLTSACPDLAEAFNHRGILNQRLKHWDKAIADYHSALAIKPSYPEALFNLGLTYSEYGDFVKSLIALEKSAAINSSLNWLLGLLLHTRMKICDWDHWTSALKTLFLKVSAGQKAAEPFHLLGVPAGIGLEKAAAELYCSAEYGNFTEPESLDVESFPSSPKLRIAYLSSDYYGHATSYLMAEMFELHDRNRFEVIGVCYGRSPRDEMRVRVSKGFDHFIEVADKSDREIAHMLREMGVDIAIDLKGHTQDSRLGILAERAAPIQIHYLGYPGTIGADFIDYLVADPTLIPEGDQTFYTEKIVYLPDTYQVNDRSRKVAATEDTRKDHGLPEHGFVYCCFNNNWKITPDIFDVWMRLLKQVEGSVLWLFEDNEDASANLRQEAVNRGVSADRLIFAKKLSPEEHLARHRHADLFLDTLYYNAHTTASDALWVGLPLITKLGDTYASRVAASLLKAIDVPELVTSSIEAYESLAIDFAKNPEKLTMIRQKLADNRLTTALFDTPRFTSNLEKAYEVIWSRHQAGLPPDHIRI